MKTATAGLRIAKAGAVTTGGSSPSNRSPVSGNSAETRGLAGMDLGADMMRNEPHDPLAVGWRKALAGIREAARQPIDPEPAVGVEHHLDDDGIFEPSRDRWPERGAQHARTTRYHFGLEGMNCHHRPQARRAQTGSTTGISRKGRPCVRATRSDRAACRSVAKETGGAVTPEERLAKPAPARCRARFPGQASGPWPAGARVPRQNLHTAPVPWSAPRVAPCRAAAA